MNLLEVSNLSFSYGPNEIIHDATINITAGKSVAISGPSGAGKSTFLRLISGSLKPSSGTLRINGTDFWNLNYDEQAKVRLNSFGFVTQDSDLFPELSALENVALPLRLAGIKAKQAHARALEVLTELGLAEQQHHTPDKLSGGQRQRVAIAMAISNNPNLLFADEPTGALDPENSGKVVALMKEQSERLGCTLIVVTHSLDVASQLDTQIMVANKQISEGTYLAC